MGGSGVAFLAFLVAALAMVLLFFVLSLLVASAQERVVAALRAGTRRVKRWGGVILILVGGWLIALAVWVDFFVGVFTA